MTTITTAKLREMAHTLGQRPEYALQVFISNFDTAIDDTPADTDETEAQEAAMQDDVERVARAIYYDAHAGLKNCWDWDDTELDIEHPGARQRYIRDARAAMAATREIDAEALREAHDGRLVSRMAIADWLQQRANEVKGCGNG